MDGDLQRHLLFLLESWVYRETGCRRSEPRTSGWSWGGSGYPSSCVVAMPVEFMSLVSNLLFFNEVVGTELPSPRYLNHSFLVRYLNARLS